MKKIRVIAEMGIFTFCILFLLSWTWFLTVFIRVGIVHPLETIKHLQSDLEYIGPYAVLLDILFILIIWFSYRRVKSKQLDKDTYNE